MLQDKSVDRQETWQFLMRRIEDGVHVQEVLNKSEDTTKNVAHAVGSAFQTVCIHRCISIINDSFLMFLIFPFLQARNILGINFNKR